MLKTSTAQEVNETVVRNEITIVKFGATWCRPCKTLDGILEGVDHTILKIDIDEEPEFTEQFGIMSIPAMVFFKDGVVKHKFVGVVSADQISEKIEELNQ